PTSGSMGYGLPGAVAMTRVFPEREVLCVAGDGDFMMTCQEFATAAQYNLPFITLIFDNGMYGTIRMHQEREYPSRVVATDLKNPDFVKFAESCGGFGIKIDRTADFAGAYKAAKASSKPALIHLKVDPEGISPALTISGIREKSLANRH
ncbi:MAG: thiamine pyrophosphate-binding protein, partial [Pseudolabrys sp.]|nr:thiamine pyrophosphate-binding protein [Pseudolabrys sp.]